MTDRSFKSPVCQGRIEGWVLKEGPGWSWLPTGNIEAKVVVFFTGNPTTSNYQTDIMNAYNKFGLTGSHKFCHYLNLSCFMLGAKKDSCSLSQQEDKHGTASHLLSLPPTASTCSSRGMGERTGGKKVKFVAWDKDNLEGEKRKRNNNNNSNNNSNNSNNNNNNSKS